VPAVVLEVGSQMTVVAVAAVGVALAAVVNSATAGAAEITGAVAVARDVAPAPAVVSVSTVVMSAVDLLAGAMEALAKLVAE